MDQAGVACPHCGEVLHGGIVAALKESTTVKFSIQIEYGHRLQAKTIGGVLSNLDTLFKASAKQLGGKVETLVDGIEFTPTQITFSLILAEIKDRKA